MNSGNFRTPEAAHRAQVTAQPGDNEALTPLRQLAASDEEVLRVLREQFEQENAPTKTPNEGGVALRLLHRTLVIQIPLLVLPRI